MFKEAKWPEISRNKMVPWGWSLFLAIFSLGLALVPRNVFFIYYPTSGHTGWDLEGTHKTVWAVGLGIFDPCKKGCLFQALRTTPVLASSLPSLREYWNLPSEQLEPQGQEPCISSPFLLMEPRVIRPISLESQSASLFPFVCCLFVCHVLLADIGIIKVLSRYEKHQGMWCGGVGDEGMGYLVNASAWLLQKQFSSCY